MTKFQRSYNFRNQQGLSLVELLVVMVIIALVATLAIFHRGNANEQFTRQNVAQELKVAFERARFDSVKRRADASATYAYVELASTTFTLRVDRNQDGVLDASDDQVYPFPNGVVADGYNFSIGSGVKIEFNRRGEATVVGGVNQPQFMVCNGAICPDEPGDAATTNTVLVTPTGTVNLLAGGVAIPTFTDPAVLNPAPDIRVEVVLP